MDTLEPYVNAVADPANPVAKVRALNALAIELARAGQAQRAFAHTREAADIAARIGDRQIDAETQHTLARCHYYGADFMASLQHLLEAARLYHEAGDAAGTAASFAGIGLCQHQLGVPDAAAAWLLRALEAAREQNMRALEINICNSLSSTLIAGNRIDEASHYLDRGIELAQQSDDGNLLCRLLLSQSQLSKRRGDQLTGSDAEAAQAEYAKGLAQARMALTFAREQRNLYDECRCLGQASTMLRLMHRYAETEDTLAQTLALAEEIEEPEARIQALIERGYLRVTQERLGDAIADLRDAVAMARGICIPTILAEACEAASRVMEQSGDTAGALAMYKEFHAVREVTLAGSRKHVTHDAQLWFDLQDASRRASELQARAETLAADHAALAQKAKVLTEISQQDPLTGLLNRRGLDMRIGALVAGSEVNATPLTVALVDVDLFKRINDNFSHAVGDAVLRRVASTISEHSRQNDLPVRYGGDEFLLVLANANLETGRQILQRLKEAIDAHPWSSETPGLRVTLSIGIATRPVGATLAATIAAADRALYEAKAAGRNRIAVGC